MEGQYYFIGETAGKLYKTLEAKGAVEFLKLQREAGIFDEALFNQAIGWLAREGKINFSKSSKVLKVSLTTANV